MAQNRIFLKKTKFIFDSFIKKRSLYLINTNQFYEKKFCLKETCKDNKKINQRNSNSSNIKILKLINKKDNLIAISKTWFILNIDYFFYI